MKRRIYLCPEHVRFAGVNVPIESAGDVPVLCRLRYSSLLFQIWNDDGARPRAYVFIPFQKL